MPYSFCDRYTDTEHEYPIDTTNAVELLNYIKSSSPTCYDCRCSIESNSKCPYTTMTRISFGYLKINDKWERIGLKISSNNKGTRGFLTEQVL